MILLLAAMVLDWFVGDPRPVWDRLPHPVVLFGKVIDRFDALRDREAWVSMTGDDDERADFAAGIALLLAFAAIAAGATLILGWLHIVFGLLGLVVELLLVSVLIAQKSLADHVGTVAKALRGGGGISEGRKAVSMIVGRDVSGLDESGVSRAAIESLAENHSDGIVAPILWYAIAGPFGILFYKMINTADSMVGHRTPRYEYFGKPAAIMDDWLNWPAARLTALLVALASRIASLKPSIGTLLSNVTEDAPTHRSPNAGWPETAYACALGIALGGPRAYGDEKVDAPFLNGGGRRVLALADIDRALGLFRRSVYLTFAIVALLAIVL